MKNNDLLRTALRRFLLSILILFFVFLNTSFSQSIKDLENEILIYIQPSVLELPANTQSILSVDNLTFHSQDLRQAFNNFSINSISKTFPNFDDSDTVRVTKDNRKIKLPQMSRIFSIHIPESKNIDSAISNFSRISGVLFAEKNMDAKLFSDPTYSNQWFLNNTGQSQGTNDADIDAPEAWSIFTGSSSVKIGVIDAGVQLNHEDLSGKVSGDAEDGIGHGTHVAGIAAAKANNPYGGRGVDWNAQILSKQIFSTSYISYPGNPDGYMGDANTYNKIYDAVNSGADIINNSWGSTSYSSTIRMAFAYAYKMNRVATVAMGNSYQFGNPTKYPAAFGQGIIAVGATTDQDVRSSFSQTGNHIDVTAPGGIAAGNAHDIWSTWINNSYLYIGGTSMATPVVSGIASLLKGAASYLYNDDIEHIIQLSADDKGSTGWDSQYGYGR